jgi:E3 ubiquitin-protein ligase DOA10
MNREALPLILAVLLPIIIISIIFLYINGYDVIAYLKKIDILYYIIIFPIFLGLLVAILKIRSE